MLRNQCQMRPSSCTACLKSRWTRRWSNLTNFAATTSNRSYLLSMFKTDIPALPHSSQIHSTMKCKFIIHLNETDQNKNAKPTSTNMLTLCFMQTLSCLLETSAWQHTKFTHTLTVIPLGNILNDVDRHLFKHNGAKWPALTYLFLTFCIKNATWKDFPTWVRHPLQPATVIDKPLQMTPAILFGLPIPKLKWARPGIWDQNALLFIYSLPALYLKFS